MAAAEGEALPGREVPPEAEALLGALEGEQAAVAVAAAVATVTVVAAAVTWAARPAEPSVKRA